MDDFKKHQIKAKIKEKKKWLIGTGIFLFVGVVAWVVGSFMSGANPVEWLTSPFAITIYILIALALIVFAMILFTIFMGNGGKLK